MRGSPEHSGLHRLTAGAPGSCRLGWGWPFAIIAAVLYGSLIPFNFEADALSAFRGFDLSRLTFYPAGLEDMATNMLVYLPVGAVLVLYIRCERLGVWLRLLSAILIGAAVSMLAETLQVGIASRVASWLDVLLNAAGTAMGALLGVTLSGVVVSLTRRWQARFLDRPFAALGSLLIFGLFFFRLAPFDFVTNTQGLCDAFLRATWTLPDGKDLQPGVAPYLPMFRELTLGVWFAALAYTLAMSGRESGRDRTAATIAAVQQGCSIVFVTELMQLFTVSHAFDAATVVIGSLSVAFGAWLAIFVVDRQTGSAWMDRSMAREAALVTATPTPILVALLVFQVSAVLASSVDPDLLSLAGFYVVRIEWMPFEAFWRRPMLVGAASAMEVFITYGVLALTLVVVLRRAGVSQAFLPTGIAVTVFAVFVEGLSAVGGSPRHLADTTSPLLAFLAVALVTRVHSTLHAPLLSARSVGSGVAER